MPDTNSSCLVGTQPLVLQNQGFCNLGFFCRWWSMVLCWLAWHQFLGPNISINNPPQYCPPTIQCQITRLLQTANTCQEPQGTYEPIVCAPGYYCPFGGKSKLICPPNHYCPLGAFRPIPCSYRSICPLESQRQIEMVGLIAIIVIDIFLCLWKLGPRLRALYRRRWTKTPTDLSSLENAVEMTPSGPSSIAPNKSDTSFDDIHGLQDFAIDLDGEQLLDADYKSFIQSLEKAIGTTDFGLSFSFTDLGLQLRGGCRDVLKRVTGHIESGSMWGVLGGSGAGKCRSTRCSWLRLSIDKTKLHFWISSWATSSPLRGTSMSMASKRESLGKFRHDPFHGVWYLSLSSCFFALTRKSSYKKIIGYVPQEDVVLPNLTVRENIIHSARVRLLASWSESQIQAHVDALIACLKLSHVQHSRVGDTINPVISGGQRKRVSIGIELAAAPMALFLDEPTSGLDATSALSVMRLLKALSRIGVTVVSIIHQPRTEIYYCLDNVLLLSEGQQLYHGKASDAPNYFTKLGYTFPSDFNPADIIMDIINGQGQKYQRCPPGGQKMSLIEEWISYQNTNEPLLKLQDQVIRDEQEAFLQNTITLRGASWPKQVLFCFSRSLIQQVRETVDFLLEVAVGGASGVLIGLSVFQLRGRLFVGMYRSPYEILSSAANYTLVPQLGLLCALAIGTMTAFIFMVLN